MKPRHRSDANAGEITVALRLAGCNVVPFESPHPGEPDLLIGFLGRLTLLEIKTERGRLAQDQKYAHAAWARVGVRVHVVRSQREAFDAVGITGERREANQASLREMAEAFEAPRRRRAEIHGLQNKIRSSARRYVSHTGNS